MSASSTTIPAAVGMLVVASFDLEAAIHGYLVVAGASGFAYLAAEALPLKDDRRVARLVGLGLVLIFSAAFATAIAAVLPLAQTQVEETMVSHLHAALRRDPGTTPRPTRRASELEAVQENRHARMERTSAAATKPGSGALRQDRMASGSGHDAGARTHDGGGRTSIRRLGSFWTRFPGRTSCYHPSVWSRNGSSTRRLFVSPAAASRRREARS